MPCNSQAVARGLIEQLLAAALTNDKTAVEALRARLVELLNARTVMIGQRDATNAWLQVEYAGYGDFVSVHVNAQGNITVNSRTRRRGELDQIKDIVEFEVRRQGALAQQRATIAGITAAVAAKGGRVTATSRTRAGGLQMALALG